MQVSALHCLGASCCREALDYCRYFRPNDLGGHFRFIASFIVWSAFHAVSLMLYINTFRSQSYYTILTPLVANTYLQWSGHVCTPKYTPCPRKKQASLIFDITLLSVEIFLQFLKHFVQD